MSLSPLRRARRGVLALTAAALAATTLAAGPAEAASVPNGSIVASGCSSQASPYSWNGAVTAGWGAPHGTVYVCWTKYKMADSDNKADYYAVVATSRWTYAAGPTGNAAAMSQTITSSVSAIDNVYSSTGTFATNTSCTGPITLSVGWGPFSASTTPTVCSGYTVTRSSYGRTGAGWSSPKAAGLRTVETLYAQKVPQGSNPRFTVRFAIPIYVNTGLNTPPYVSTTVMHNTVSFYG